MERLDRMESHSRDRESSRHDRKERSTGDRVLEDLRERYIVCLGISHYLTEMEILIIIYMNCFF